MLELNNRERLLILIDECKGAISIVQALEQDNDTVKEIKRLRVELLDLERQANALNMYKVNTGYTAKGNPRFKRFTTFAAAEAFCSSVFNASGVVLSIVKG